MDAVIAVIDPLPSKLIPGGLFIQRLCFILPKTVFVVNKINKGVHKGELKRFLKGIDTYLMPLVSTQFMYKAEYNCILPYAIPAIKGEIDKPLKALSDALIHVADLSII
jgi:hypothetical protein